MLKDVTASTMMFRQFSRGDAGEGMGTFFNKLMTGKSASPVRATAAHLTLVDTSALTKQPAGSDMDLPDDGDNLLGYHGVSSAISSQPVQPKPSIQRQDHVSREHGAREHVPVEEEFRGLPGYSQGSAGSDGDSTFAYDYPPVPLGASAIGSSDNKLGSGVLSFAGARPLPGIEELTDTQPQDLPEPVVPAVHPLIDMPRYSAGAATELPAPARPTDGSSDNQAEAPLPDLGDIPGLKEVIFSAIEARLPALLKDTLERFLPQLALAKAESPPGEKTVEAEQLPPEPSPAVVGYDSYFGPNTTINGGSHDFGDSSVSISGTFIADKLRCGNLLVDEDASVTADIHSTGNVEIRGSAKDCSIRGETVLVYRTGSVVGGSVATKNLGVQTGATFEVSGVTTSLRDNNAPKDHSS